MRRRTIVTVVTSLPAAGDCQTGEMFYVSATNRLYIKTGAGWKYAEFT